jgi:hypothetical protein
VQTTGVGENSYGPEWVSYVPIIGSGRDAYRDFQKGDYGWAVFNAAMAVSDVFLVKSIVVAGGKVLIRGGIKLTSGHSWAQTKAYWSKKGITELMGGSKHHWAISQELMRKYPALLPVGNQPWNIIKFATHAEHMRLAHGKTWLGQRGANILGQVWHGTPTWFKTSIMYGTNGVENGSR